MTEKKQIIPGQVKENNPNDDEEIIKNNNDLPREEEVKADEAKQEFPAKNEDHPAAS
jgi:hypothetical protein